MKWKNSEIKEMLRLNKRGFLNTQIAVIMRKKPAQIGYQLRKIGFFSQRKGIGAWNIKHKHLRKKVMQYYMTHSYSETAQQFNLTNSELKSLMTYGYRDKKLAHLRKDSRRKDSYSSHELSFLLQHAGIQNRAWISKKLKRGTYHSTKEIISRLGCTTRYINGLPIGLAIQLLDPSVNIPTINSKAGPALCRIKLVPWVVIYSLAKNNHNIPFHILTALETMANFQKFVHGTKDTASIVKSLTNKARKK